MFVLCKKTGKLINLDKTSELFIGKSGNTLTVARENGSMGVIVEYDTGAEAKEALAMLVEFMNVGKRDVFIMPDSEEVKQRLSSRREQYHHATGKKTKGYGGS